MAALHCDYHPDCPHGEDEDGCGESAFCINVKQAADTCSKLDFTILSEV